MRLPARRGGEVVERGSIRRAEEFQDFGVLAALARRFRSFSDSLGHFGLLRLLGSAFPRFSRFFGLRPSGFKALDRLPDPFAGAAFTGKLFSRTK